MEQAAIYATQTQEAMPSATPTIIPSATPSTIPSVTPSPIPSATLLPVVTDVDLSGEWTGIMTQPTSEIALNYKFGMILVQSGNDVEGVSKVEDLNNPEYYGVMNLRGTISDGVFHFEEMGVIEQNTIPDTV